MRRSEANELIDHNNSFAICQRFEITSTKGGGVQISILFSTSVYLAIIWPKLGINQENSQLFKVVKILAFIVLDVSKGCVRASFNFLM